MLINIYDQQGKIIETLVNESKTEGDHEINWNAGKLPAGFYTAVIELNRTSLQTLKLNKTN